jgi:hypothetical protein
MASNTFILIRECNSILRCQYAKSNKIRKKWKGTEIITSRSAADDVDLYGGKINTMKNKYNPLQARRDTGTETRQKKLMIMFRHWDKKEDQDIRIVNKEWDTW